ncbi:MAG: zinc-ribbon domain-containing protein [Sandaracinaceae bacterium]|nr:zinc-ribbon domain-containing protein [Sandaracinaceae bacterium]
MLPPMLFCQQCGAGNSEDARFCNQCGGKIARPGEPGGPLASAPGDAPETTLQGRSEPASRATPPPQAPEEAREEPAAEPTPAPRPERRSLPEVTSPPRASTCPR